MSFLIILVAAWGTGSVMLSRVPIHDPLESLGCRLLCGLVAVAVVAMAVGSYSLSGAQYILGVVALVAVLNSLRSTARVPGPAFHVQFSGLTRLEAAAVAAILCAWLLALIGALAPSTGWDAAVAHLALPSDYGRAGRILTEPGNVYSGYPHIMHSLYAVAMLGNRELPVSLLNWSMGGLACTAVYSLGRRVGTRQTGLVSAALLATAPIYLDQAGNVGIDLPFVACSTAALAAVVAWHDEKKIEWLLIAGVLAGASCGIRHTGYLVCGLLAIGVVALSVKTQPIRRCAVFSVVALLAASPWLMRSWLVTGNPIFPFLLSVFPDSPIDHIAVSTPGAHESIGRSSGMGLAAFLRFPWDIVMRPAMFDGWNKSPGGMILILGVPGLIVGGARAWWLGAFSAAGGTAFFFFQRLARYLLPFFAPMMVVAALAAERLPRGRRAVAVLLMSSFGYGLALHAAAVHFKIPVVLGRQSKQEYLNQRVERYGAFEFANRRLNDGGTILTLDQRSYYLDAPSYQNHWSLKRIAALSLDDQVAWLHENKIRYVMVPEDFVAESGALSGEIGAMVASWQRTPQYFELVDTPLQLPRKNGGGVEKVSFYAVH
ncbi:MAG: glycosyltransferase family 39 protein [Candidatus Hydrogenedentes bacterium]|nr:glycosyltransferase family 39 protein [Candidatus Hydrogenedentota bacterium]